MIFNRSLESQNYLKTFVEVLEIWPSVALVVNDFRKLWNLRDQLESYMTFSDRKKDVMIFKWALHISYDTQVI